MFQTMNPVQPKKEGRYICVPVRYNLPIGEGWEGKEEIWIVDVVRVPECDGMYSDEKGAILYDGDPATCLAFGYTCPELDGKVCMIDGCGHKFFGPLPEALKYDAGPPPYLNGKKTEGMEVELHHHVFIERRGEEWAICKAVRSCLGKDYDWHHESMPSSRTDEFINLCRFDTETEAFDFWEKWKAHVLEHGDPSRIGKK
jgi:hypothetical protein